ncbi:MAG: diguanylate cyclase [Azonexus sp.]|jgi:diguanylate cyclase (GGDEF)-like protein|nr:diguanylate cyclase [Azonexus sp.]
MTSSSFHSAPVFAEALETHWRDYRTSKDFAFFVEFAVSLNSLSEYLKQCQMPGLMRLAEELEHIALALFGDAAQHPLLAEQRDNIEGKLAHLLDELRHHKETTTPGHRQSDAPGSDCQKRSRGVLIVATDDHPSLEAMCGQLRFFGFLPAVTSWSELTTAEQAPLAILCLPEQPGAWPEATVTAIASLRTHFPSSHIYCLEVPVELENIIRLQRAGVDTCIPATSGYTDILPLLLNLVRDNEQEADRVLIVEDSQVATAVARRALAQHGINSLSIADPRHLLDVVAQYRPDAILMDMYMPFCSGVEATAALRQVAAYQSLPVIYLSGETDIAQQVEALRLGGDQFLTKPFNPVVLAAVVKTKIARYREMRQSSQHDGLTGLLNHTTSKMRISQRVAEASPGDRFVVAMLDIDRFKRINDTYGHPTGDQVIRDLAWLLRGRLRSSDLIGRYGGEEFIVALSDIDLACAITQLERIREDFAVLPHAHNSAGGAIYASFSCGVAALADYPDASALIAAADMALLQAKRSGRNRVVAAAIAASCSIVRAEVEEAAGSAL